MRPPRLPSLAARTISPRWFAVETADGIQNLGGIVQVGIERPFCLAFGAGDFTGDLEIEWTGAETECAWARNTVVVASRAGRLPKPLDSVFADIGDMDGLKQNARAAKAMGFQRKLAIHPDQVAAIQDIFSPQPDEISWAERVLDGMKQAEEGGLARSPSTTSWSTTRFSSAKAIQARLNAQG